MKSRKAREWKILAEPGEEKEMITMCYPTDRIITTAMQGPEAEIVHVRETNIKGEQIAQIAHIIHNMIRDYYRIEKDPTINPEPIISIFLHQQFFIIHEEEPIKQKYIIPLKKEKAEMEEAKASRMSEVEQQLMNIERTIGMLDEDTSHLFERLKPILGQPKTSNNITSEKPEQEYSTPLAKRLEEYHYRIINSHTTVQNILRDMEL